MLWGGASGAELGTLTSPPTPPTCLGDLLAVLPGLGDVPWVGVLCDRLAHFTVTVRGEEGSRLNKEAKAVVESVAFLWSILREEAVSQGVIAHDVLDLQKSRRAFHSVSIQLFTCLCIHLTKH